MNKRAHLPSSLTLVHVFTDRRNSVYVFALLVLRRNTPRHEVSKKHRRAIHIARFEFFINLIRGTNNIFAHIQYRWSKPFRAKTALIVTPLNKGIISVFTEMKSIKIDEIIF